GEPSDERLKDNITDSTVDALQIITSLQMRAFDWIETDVQEDVGLIAQEVEEIAPELVSENNGIKHINPTRLLWYCVKAIQQLSGELPRTALMKSDE
ncbi:tail fiber domain-containing protein, partial [Erysipelatoclostridium ramosum]|nr:tail fiber domain-containing protein [Thomasclavelia ramosa]